MHPFALSEGVHFYLSGGSTFLYEMHFKGKSSILFVSVKGSCDASKALSGLKRRERHCRVSWGENLHGWGLGMGDRGRDGYG